MRAGVLFWRFFFFFHFKDFGELHAGLPRLTCVATRYAPRILCIYIYMHSIYIHARTRGPRRKIIIVVMILQRPDVGCSSAKIIVEHLSRGRALHNCIYGILVCRRIRSPEPPRHGLRRRPFFPAFRLFRRRRR